ncbi:hypothetical protein NQ314_020222 [Rhamnusium bicolor]|uniref:DDE-1 domain-containing protein n=1 Tax=Rhamnusium bicolor TaxID=1586634 RepID=A0AAV8WMH6_9CUCU|nr:hypothetical protein NQ314_020222 [Rhamnusium bicolor]
MPRKPRRILGARNFKNYSQDKLQQALEEIRSKSISLRNAAKKYQISKNTLWNKLHGKHERMPGKPRVFTEQEEESFAGHLIALSAFGFPVTGEDLKIIVKSYLNRQGRKVPSNIWNYNETNLVDDLGRSKVITRKGTKYPEKIRNSSKACTSLMICGNAEGRLAPVYVNYKSQKLWSTWTEDGPLNARYNRTSSGWFDFQVFEDWFINLMLPLLKRQEGRKILIGDNLSSHLNLEVIIQCELNNVRFIALPPNTTHLLQPLDVAYFRPMKGNWRHILNDWKNIVADDPIIKKVVGESFLGHLTQKRQEATASRICRKKKLQVAPGKGITVSDVQNPVATEPVDYSQPSTSGIQNISIPEELSDSSDSNKSLPLIKKPMQKTKRRKNRSDSSDDSIDSVTYAESDDSPFNPELSDDPSVELENIKRPAFSEKTKRVGDYVLVIYDRKYYPGEITKVLNNGAIINVMTPYGKQWKWPCHKDEIFYSDEEIVMAIKEPERRGHRYVFDVPELNNLA